MYWQVTSRPRVEYPDSINFNHGRLIWEKKVFMNCHHEGRALQEEKRNAYHQYIEETSGDISIARARVVGGEMLWS